MKKVQKNDALQIQKRFHLFRLVLEKKVKDEPSIADSVANRADVLEHLLTKAPRFVDENGTIYQASRTFKIDDSGFYFKFGVEKKSPEKKFDEKKYDFVDFEGSKTQYAYCFYCPKNQLLAVERKSKFYAPSIIANKIALTLEGMKNNPKYHLDNNENLLFLSSVCKSRIVYRPTEFITEIKQAKILLSFTVSIPIQNPYDFENMLADPMKKYMDEVNASESKVTVANKEGLATDKLVDMSHKMAAYGAGASAIVKQSAESKEKKVSLNSQKNSAVAECKLDKGTTIEQNKESIFKRILEVFKAIHDGHKE
jgi:hypothetical protein